MSFSTSTQSSPPAAVDASRTRARAEPHLGEPPRADESAAREWVRYAAMHEQPELLRPRRSWLRLGWTAAIFAFGTMVGIATAWWLAQPSPVQPLVSMPAHVQAPDPAREGNGITPSELPYDGQAPAPQAIPPMALKPALPEDLPARSAKPAASAPDEGAPRTEARSAAPPREDAKQATAPAAPVTSKNVATPPSEKKLAAGDAVPTKPHSVARSTEHRSTSRRSYSRAAKDREIERIKEQAAEELKKKADAGRSESRAAVKETPRQQEGNSVRALLARCERAPNFIFREQCKWQLCSGKWGKNGCPSYQTQASTF